MFCPQCGQERTSQATSFCSRCGFLLTGTSELLQTGGAPLLPAAETPSPRSRGVRAGLFMFLLIFVVAPLVGIISFFALGMEPWPVGVAIFLLGGGGLLRIAYALMFESKYPPALAEGRPDRELYPSSFDASTAVLPPQRDLAASEYTSPQSGRWRDTNELEPTSVTESTTKLLEKDPD